MNIIPWYVNVCFSLPFLLLGFFVGWLVANRVRAQRLVVATAGAAGAVLGEWLGLVFLPRPAHSTWLTAFAGSLAGGIVLSVAAAWFMKPR